jgi:cytochrome b561
MPANLPGYGSKAVLIHWIVAALLVVQFLAGWNLDAHDSGMPAGPISNLHASLGIAIGLLVLYRLVTRFIRKVPQLPTLPAWQRHAAETVHVLLLVMLIVMPVAGVVTALNEGAAFVLFGFVPLPMMTPSEGLADLMEETHELGATILLALAGVHIAAALYHHFILKDDVLRRMLPFA